MSKHLIKRTFRFKLRKWVSKSIKLKRIIYSPSKTRTLSFFKHLHSLLLNIKVAFPLGHEQKHRSPSSLLTSALNLAQFMESLLSWSHNEGEILKESVPCCQPWSPSDLTLKISRSSDMVIAVKYIFTIKINSILNILMFLSDVLASRMKFEAAISKIMNHLSFEMKSLCTIMLVSFQPRKTQHSYYYCSCFYENYLCQSWLF